MLRRLHELLSNAIALETSNWRRQGKSCAGVWRVRPRGKINDWKKPNVLWPKKGAPRLSPPLILFARLLGKWRNGLSVAKAYQGPDLADKSAGTSWRVSLRSSHFQAIPLGALKNGTFGAWISKMPFWKPMALAAWSFITFP